MRTIESSFEYQAKEIFKEMEEDYKEEQESRKYKREQLQTFAEWLWLNPVDLGKIFYDKLDSWCGIDEFTEDLNIK